MKIAISAMGDNLSSQVDPRFGRARWFVIVDTETGAVSSFENMQNVEAAQGAGIQTAASVARSGVGCVITGHCGPNAFRTLESQNIKVIVGASGTVEEMVKQFKEGKLESASAPDVEGHWV
jgi:predicted Fe-Mo cluster-binding NifX family protein